MAQWTSKDAILRDLRRAQGGAGAARPEPRPLLAAERPPRLRLTEENEEEFFRHCVGDGGVGDKPDLGLIQQMLDMVRNLNVSENEVRATDAAVISKLNPVSAEFVPAAAAAAPPLDTQPPARKTKRVRQRNVALESIFRAIESRKPSGEAPSAGEPPSLLKPEDLVPNVDVDDKVKSEAVEKVNDWMSQMSKPIRDKPVAVVLDSYNMFKKKVKPERSRASAGAGAGDAGAGAGSGTGGAGGAGGGAYVPSTHAEALYVAYVQRGRRQEEAAAAARRRDVWTRAQAQMKRIDHNKRVEAAQQSVEAEAALKVVPEVVAATLAAVTPAAEDAEDDSEASSATMETVSSASSFTDLLQCKILNASWQHVRLPRHRHRLRAPCAVCAARHAPPVPPATPPAPPVPPVPPATPPGPRADLACNTI